MGAGCACGNKAAAVAAQPERRSASPSEEYAEDPASSLPRLPAWASNSGARQLATSSGQRPYKELVAAADGGSLPQEVLTAIDNDVSRTFFPNVAPPSEEEVKTLRRILCALAVWDTEVAYCQGLNFLAFFAMTAAKRGPKDPPTPEVAAQDEEDTFWLVACLLSDYGARGLFLSKTPVLKLYGYCLSQLMKSRLPEFHRSLSGLDAVLSFKWFGTLFTTVLPREAALRAWDLVLRDGLSMLLGVALGLCALVAPALERALQEGFEAPEFLGLLQRQLPAEPAQLLPADWRPAAGREAEHRAQKAGRRLVEAAELQRCSLSELTSLLEQWRQECPTESAELGDDFSWSYII